MQYALLIYTPEPTEEPTAGGHAAEMEGYNAFTEHVRARGACEAGEALDSVATATTVRVARRQDDDDRRTVRRDEGDARRLLPRRGGRSRRGDRLRRDDPRRAARRIEVRPVWDWAAERRCGAACTRRPAPADRSRRPVLARSEAAHDVVDRVFREEQGRAVATLIRVLGDFDLAEEAVQDAFISALETWPQRGVPDNPGAWITTTARNRAIDRLRRRKRLTEKTETLAREAALEDGPARHRRRAAEDAMQIADDRLRLIFTCCHPALALDARVALTLRTLGGLDHARDRPGVPRPGADPRPATGPRQAQDPRRRDPVPRPAGGAAAGAARRRPARPVPGVQRGLRGVVGRCAGAPRAVRRGDPPGTGRRVVAARRARGDRVARPDAPPRRPARGAGRVRPGS